MKKTTLLGSLILGIIAVLAVIVIMSTTGLLGSDATTTLVFSSNNGEGIYNGKPLTKDGWQLVSGELEKGHTVSAEVYGARTDVGVSENSLRVKILDENKADVSDRYNIEYKPGTLTVKARQIKLLSGSASKRYDGTPLESESYQLVSGSLLSGHTLDVQYGISRTEVGVSENAISATVLNEKGEDITSNYEIEALMGSLTVTGYPLTISTQSMEKVYDGTPLTRGGYEILSGELQNGDRLFVTVIGSQTDAGESPNDFAIQILSVNGEDVTARYEITRELGSLKVLPRDVLVETESKTERYRGLPLEHKVYQTYGDLAKGHTIYISVTGRITTVGAVENTFFVEVKDENGNIVTHNYNIAERLGVLELLPVDIVIATSSAWKNYDGTPLSSLDYELKVGRLLDGHIISVKVTGIQESVGISDNTFTYTIVDESGLDVSSLYEVNEELGTLEIKPIEITIRTKGESKVYDGLELRVNQEGDWEIHKGELYTGHTIVGELVGMQKHAGVSPNTLEYTIYDENGVDVTSCYLVTEEFGELLVLPISLTIETQGDSKTYDGTPLTKDGYELLLGELLGGHMLTVTVNGERTEVGVSDNTFVYTVMDSEGNDITGNYDVTPVMGQLRILPIGLAVTTGDSTKYYDGTPLTNSECELVGGELMEGHTIEMYTVGTITNAGEATNDVYFCVLDENGADVTSAYEIIPNYGILKVLPIEITVETKSDYKIYDGTELVCHEYEIIAGELLEGHYIEMTFDGTITEVGLVDNYFRYIIYNENGEKVSANYKVYGALGTLEIMGVPLTINTTSAKKTYDGKPLTAEGYEIVKGELLEGHTLNLVTTGSRTEAGIGFNYADWSIVDENGNDVKKYYDVTMQQGALEVEPIKIYVTSNGASKMYDGEVLREESCNIIGQDKIDKLGHNITVVYSQFPVLAGEYDNKMDIQIVDSEGFDVTSNYEITKTSGRLVITQRTVTVMTQGAQKVYDGIPLTEDGYKVVSQTQVLDNHTLIVVCGGEQTVVGESENFIAEIRVVDNATGNEVTMNYDFSLSRHGILKVLDPSQVGQDDGEPEEIPDQNTLLATVISQTTGTVYLRQMSFGSYNGTYFNEAPSYPAYINNVYGMSYLTSFALKNAGYQGYEMTVSYKAGVYFLPYYLDTVIYDYKVQTNDVYFNEDGCEQSLLFYIPYTYEGKGVKATLPSELAELELAYRDFVYQNYLDVPTKTREFLEGVIEAEGFRPNDPQVVAKVAKYIQGCATYNLDFDPALDQENDIVIAFMSEYKEGLCRHYAMSAAMLLRTLGIPARYTVGAVAEIKEAGVETEVWSEQFHAWTEVYIDGVGWVALEVTGSSNSGGGNGGGGNGNGSGNGGEGEGEGEGGGSGGSGEGGESDKPVITVRPATQEKKYYDGALLEAQPILSGDSAYQNMISMGYYFDCEVSGYLDTVGYGESVIEEIYIYDVDGNDVTSQFTIRCEVGKLHMYLESITVKGNSISVDYTGDVVTCDTYVLEGTLLDGHRLSVTFGEGRSAIGIYQNRFTYAITDENGENVTELYKVNATYGTITIRAIRLTIEADSSTFTQAELEALGGIYYAKEWEITAGKLREGHTIEVKLDGYIDDLGRCDSYITGVIIRDKNGADVTANYQITYVDGEMSVTR